MKTAEDRDKLVAAVQAVVKKHPDFKSLPELKPPFACEVDTMGKSYGEAMHELFAAGGRYVERKSVGRSGVKIVAK